jgi:hypothetical protein
MLGFLSMAFALEDRTAYRQLCGPKLAERVPVYLAFRIRLIFAGINILDLLPYGGKILVVRTIGKCHTYADDNLRVATNGFEHAKDFADLAIGWHGIPQGTHANENPPLRNLDNTLISTQTHHWRERPQCQDMDLLL